MSRAFPALLLRSDRRGARRQGDQPMVEITIVLAPSVSRVSLAATREVRAGADGWRLRR